MRYLLDCLIGFACGLLSSELHYRFVRAPIERRQIETIKRYLEESQPKR